jgi:hypothetical protein
MDPLTLRLTAFQAGEIEHGLDTDAASHPDDPDWGQLDRLRNGRCQLIIRPTQQARDRALYRITSCRDILMDNSSDPFNGPAERRRYAAQGRSMASLAVRLIEAAGGISSFSPDMRRWARY